MVESFLITLLFLGGLIGGGGPAEEPAAPPPAQEGRFGTITGGEGGKKLAIDPPPGPPPKGVLSRDLEVGDGAVARYGDEVEVYYIAVDYKTGKEKYSNWPPSPDPFGFRLGFGAVNGTWQEGIEGMRVGGRRELIIPSHLFYGTGSVDYVVDLVDVQPAS
jgi:peptidylprolyl isomerase